MSKYIVMNDLGCIYRVVGGQVQYAPYYYDTPTSKNYLFDDEDFADVEPELVGSELVTVDGKEMTLDVVYEWVLEQLDTPPTPQEKAEFEAEHYNNQLRGK